MRYRLFLNEIYDRSHQVDHDGVERFIEADTLNEATERAYAVARALGAHAYRLMEGGAAQYKLTSSFAVWWY